MDAWHGVELPIFQRVGTPGTWDLPFLDPFKAMARRLQREEVLNRGRLRLAY